MGKGRFTTLDLAAIVSDLKPVLEGARVGNIYSVNSTTYLFKTGGGDNKKLLLVESGVRVHCTQYQRETTDAPNAFAAKLRKHLKNRRITGVRQMGVDRVICITFGTEERQTHLVLQLFGLGNILLCDNEFCVIALVRNAEHDADPLSVGSVFRTPVEREASMELPSLETLRDWLRHAQEQYAEALEGPMEQKKGRKTKKISPKKLREKYSLSRVLVRELKSGPAMCDHGLVQCDLSPSLCVDQIDLDDEAFLSRVQEAVSESQTVLELVRSEPRGFVVARSEMVPKAAASIKRKGPRRKQKTEAIALTESAADQRNNDSGVAVAATSADAADAAEYTQHIVYEMFLPFPLAQFMQDESKMIKEFGTFDAACDEFFSESESQRTELKLQKLTNAAWAKVERVRSENRARIESLRQTQAHRRHLAEVVQLNADVVEAACDAVRDQLARGIDWNDLAQLIKGEAQRGNPVAGVIRALKLKESKITVALVDPTVDHCDDEGKPATVSVDVSLNLTAMANARELFGERRSAIKKEEKTAAAQQLALKAAEVRTQEALKDIEIQHTAQIRKLRKKFWFEKFHWFITQDDLLVVGGKDAQQNELLVKKYANRSRDIYLHTEAHGGSSVLVKLPVGTTLPPPSSLLQAAQFCASRSSAWKNRALTNVFWVHANQVSKSAQSGQYLPTGSFVIRGKRHFLPAPQLVMGACVMFKVSRQSWQKHHRHERQTDADKAAEMRAAIDAAQKKREEEDKKFRERFSHLGFEDEDDEALEEHQVAAPSKAPRSQQQRSKNRRNKKKQEKAAKKHEKQLESSKSSDNALPRGRKQKLRRLQKKQRGKELFEDVDEEERELRHRLLGTRDVSLTPSALTDSSAEGKDSTPVEKEEDTESRVDDDRNEENEEGQDIAQAALQAQQERQKQHEVALKDDTALSLERQELQRQQSDAQADEATKNDAWHYFTGSPHEDDEIEYAIPMVAPYALMEQFKYKVKLTPGATRRGKAAKHILNIVCAHGEASEEEIDLIKAIQQQEWLHCLPADTKVTAPATHGKRRR